jgi:hypothetical protein
MMNDDLIPVLFKELGKLQNLVESQRLQIDNQRITIETLTDIIQELRGELDAKDSS